MLAASALLLEPGESGEIALHRCALLAALILGFGHVVASFRCIGHEQPSIHLNPHFTQASPLSTDSSIAAARLSRLLAAGSLLWDIFPSPPFRE
jgi:hypothetical protein